VARVARPDQRDGRGERCRRSPRPYQGVPPILYVTESMPVNDRPLLAPRANLALPAFITNEMRSQQRGIGLLYWRSRHRLACR
jgi:hypothetical protein